MSSTRLSCVLLAVSPAIVVVLTVVAIAFAGTAWLALFGCLTVYGPLFFLVIRGPFADPRRGIRTLMWLAVGSVVLLLLGIALALGPGFLLVTDSGPPAIVVERAPQRPNAYEVKGLNVRWAPVIRKAPPNAGFFFGIDMSQKGGSQGGRPPGKIEDGYGNHVQFTEVRAGVLRLEDNAGGFAEVDWNGPRPQLVASNAVRRTAAARGPAPFALRAVGVGQLLLWIAPLTAWMFFTMALRRLADRNAGGLLTISLWIQWSGLAVNAMLLILIWTGGSRSGEAGIAMAFLILVLLIPAFLISLIGVGLFSLMLLRGGGIE